MHTRTQYYVHPITAKQLESIAFFMTSNVHNLGTPLLCRDHSHPLEGMLLHTLNCIDASLERMDFTGARLDNVNFTGANLRWARFVNCSITGVDFDHATMHLVSFTGAVLEDCNFFGADLRYGDFIFAAMSECDFSGANLASCMFNHARIEECDFDNAGMSWTSHDLAAYRFLVAAEREERPPLFHLVAGWILANRALCWEQLITEYPPALRELARWAFTEVLEWGTEESPVPAEIGELITDEIMHLSEEDGDA